MDFEIREGTPDDGEALLALLPRLAAFPKPAYRTDPEIYRTDERVLRTWMRGEAPSCRIILAEDADKTLLGFALVTLRPEVLNGEPSAHLETLVVAEAAEGRGVGSALMTGTDELARSEGAKTPHAPRVRDERTSKSSLRAQRLHRGVAPLHQVPRVARVRNMPKLGA